MTIKDAYTTMYHILDSYFVRHNQSNSLASLLSDMDPYVFSDGKAADMATYDDWYSVVSGFAKGGEIPEDDITTALKAFLTYYHEEFGYDLKDAIEFVASMEER